MILQSAVILSLLADWGCFCACLKLWAFALWTFTVLNTHRKPGCVQHHLFHAMAMRISTQSERGYREAIAADIRAFQVSMISESVQIFSFLRPCGDTRM